MQSFITKLPHENHSGLPEKLMCQVIIFSVMDILVKHDKK